LWISGFELRIGMQQFIPQSEIRSPKTPPHSTF
jgi:hypothetical protein